VAMKRVTRCQKRVLDIQHDQSKISL